MSESSSGLVARLSSVNPGQPCSQQVILDEIRRVTLAGDAPPGTAIPLEAVARFFVVSPIPVRESLKTLIGEGLVDHEPRGGYRVARLTREEMREFYVIREVLEGAALRFANIPNGLFSVLSITVGIVVMNMINRTMLLTSILGTGCSSNRVEVQRGGNPKRRLRPFHQGMGMSSSGKPASMSTGV